MCIERRFTGVVFIQGASTDWYEKCDAALDLSAHSEESRRKRNQVWQYVRNYLSAYIYIFTQLEMIKR